jgi:hypothetical protein
MPAQYRETPKTLHAPRRQRRLRSAKPLPLF